MGMNTLNRKRGGDKISTATQHQDKKKKNAPRKIEKGNALPPVQATVAPHFRQVVDHAETNTDGGDDDEINIRENSESVDDSHDIPKRDADEEKHEKIDDDDDDKAIENLKKQLELMVNKRKNGQQR